MNQPPQNQSSGRLPPQWRRPVGVAEGTWHYVNQRSIADHYDDFVADTPLCTLDQKIVQATFPGRLDDSGQSIVDLGCGTGRTVLPLSRRGYHLLAVDLSEAMLQRLVTKRDAQNVANGDVANGSGTVQPMRANLVQLQCIAENSLDHAVCLFSTLGMVAGRRNRETVLQHVSRIVRPGGRFVLHVHHRYSAVHEPGGLRKLSQSWWNSITRSDADFGDSVYQYRGLDEMFMHRFSRRELKAILTSTHWQIDELYFVSLDGASVTKSLFSAGGFIVVATNAKSGSQ
jgi:SAM-dependent methyltransferase